MPPPTRRRVSGEYDQTLVPGEELVDRRAVRDHAFPGWWNGLKRPRPITGLHRMERLAAREAILPRSAIADAAMICKKLTFFRQIRQVTGAPPYRDGHQRPTAGEISQAFP